MKNWQASLNLSGPPVHFFCFKKYFTCDGLWRLSVWISAPYLPLVVLHLLLGTPPTYTSGEMLFMDGPYRISIVKKMRSDVSLICHFLSSSTCFFMSHGYLTARNNFLLLSAQLKVVKKSFTCLKLKV